MKRKDKELTLLPFGPFRNREIRVVDENKFLVSSFEEPHRILEFCSEK
jgi:hypothetical protein